MRQQLKVMEGIRAWFLATYSDRSIRTLSNGDSVETALLENVKYDNQIITDHAWIDWSIGLDRLLPKPETEIMFLATVKAYKKSDEIDFGFAGAIWHQEVTENPKLLPVMSIPETREEAQALLNQFGYWNEGDRSREFRMTEFDRDSLTALVFEGWCEMSPNNFDYWAKRSRAFSRLLDNLNRDKSVMQHCQLASIINGGTVAAFSGDGWGEKY